MASRKQDLRLPARRLTVAIVARDADEHLADTLESVSGLADEILVLDAGQNRDLQAIAERYGALVFAADWADDFSAAYNHIAGEATGHWVLWLEPGERLAAEDSELLHRFFQQPTSFDKAYTLLVVAPAAAGQISREQVAQVRLAPNRSSTQHVGRARPTMRASLAAANITIEMLPWRILRGEAAGPEGEAQRARRELRLIDLEIADLGRAPHLIVARAEALARLGDAGAMALFAEACQTAEPGSTAQREAYYGLLTALGADMSARETLTKICLEALAIFPLDAQLLCAVGGYMQSQNRLDLAEQACAAAFEHGRIDPLAWHVADIHEIAAVCLAVSLEQQNRDAEARTWLERAVERFPKSTRVRRHLIELCIQRGERQRALEETDRLPGDARQRESLRTAVRGALLAAQHEWPEAIRFLQAAYEDGCRDGFCFRWLTEALLTTGRDTEAAEVTHEWLTREPENPVAQYFRAAIEGAPTPAAATVAIEMPLALNLPISA